MKLGFFILAALAMVLLGGCDVARGPAIFNGTGDVLQITARFDDGPFEVRLEPQQVYWQLKAGRVLQSLVLIDNDQRREIGSDVLGPLLKRFAKTDDVVVVVRADTLNVRSISEAKREGLFTKR
jgi:hypothetical protein